MTTTPPPFDDLDLSAVLDGDADPALAARIAADPEAQVELDRRRTARDLLAAATVPALADRTVDRLVAAALHAGEAGSPVGAEAGPDDLDHAEVMAPLTRRRSQPAPAWLVAAAVLMLMGIGLTLVYTGRDDPELALDTVSSSNIATDTDGAAATAADAANEEAATQPDAAVAESPAELPDPAPPDDSSASTTAAPSDRAPVLILLGAFEDADALRVHLHDGFPSAADGTGVTSTATETDVDAAFRCLGKIDTMFGTGSDPVHVGLATVADEATVVYELPYQTDGGRDTTLVVAVGELTCIPSLSFQR